MAATLYLQLRPNKHRAIQNPRLIQFFSTSTSDPASADAPQDTTTTATSPSQSQSQIKPSSSFSSYFSDVKASLKQQSPPQRRPFSPYSAPFPPPKTTTVESLEEIRKNLSQFRLRAPAADGKPQSPPQSAKHISFQELYKRNVVASGEEEASRAGGANKGVNQNQNLSFKAIRESLRQLREAKQAEGASKGNATMSLAKFRETLNLRPADPSSKDSPLVIGGSDALPSSVFGREMRERKETESPEMKTEFLRNYSYDALGEKLRMLRPEAKGENWFSLAELNERLEKLREVEKKELESSSVGVNFRDLRESLMKLKMSDDAKTKNSTIQRLDVLGQLSQTPTFKGPPKEQLVEKYFHPDNMSSSEKLKLELQKVRDEFKMSESDCGSARVQVAQLTTKIKHLSTALHKKDKHSRKGLQEMVQRRKKLLKYLRRTDWDSYTLVLSKLGLRDNPTYKS